MQLQVISQQGAESSKRTTIIGDTCITGVKKLGSGGEYGLNGEAATSMMEASAPAPESPPPHSACVPLPMVARHPMRNYEDTRCLLGDAGRIAGAGKAIVHTQGERGAVQRRDRRRGMHLLHHFIGSRSAVSRVVWPAAGAIRRTSTEARDQGTRRSKCTDGLTAAATDSSPPPGLPSRSHPRPLGSSGRRPASRHRGFRRRGARDEGPRTGGRHRDPGGEEALEVRGGGGCRGGAGLLLRRRAARRAPRPPRALPLKYVSHPSPKPYLHLVPSQCAHFPDPGISSSSPARARSQGIPPLAF
ncbi:hypothetical protein HU200_031796 [Digitaria exilis]|uniref:Uncharacterized protein n=1 Tax=Digitaria exilis TaxID=1010633 RepID=A0A835EQW9_9POAL|nr:hypothetical protein HU200_031796 [Digitaria exilis]